MSCGRTSATRPMISGMATSIYDICPPWPPPPHVARMTREASGKEAEIGRPLRYRGRFKLPASHGSWRIELLSRSKDVVGPRGVEPLDARRPVSQSAGLQPAERKGTRAG